MGLVELALAFEEEFGIEIPMHLVEELATVKDWVRYVEANG